jgi:hypothetical protein
MRRRTVLIGELAKDAARLSKHSKHYNVFVSLADESAYPGTCPWSVEEALDKDFRP